MNGKNAMLFFWKTTEKREFFPRFFQNQQVFFAVYGKTVELFSAVHTYMNTIVVFAV